jgi:hypothetical protein
VYVCAVEPCYPAAKVLKPGDVITHFNGHAIADDGTFMFTYGGADPAAQNGAAASSPGPDGPATQPTHAPQPKCAGSPSSATAAGNAGLHTLCSPVSTTSPPQPAASSSPVKPPKGQQSVRMDFRHLVSMHYDGDECTVSSGGPQGIHCVLHPSVCYLHKSYY